MEIIIYKGYEIKKIHNTCYEVALKNDLSCSNGITKNTNLRFTKVMINKDIKKGKQ